MSYNQGQIKVKTLNMKANHHTKNSIINLVEISTFKQGKGKPKTKLV